MTYRQKKYWSFVVIVSLVVRVLLRERERKMVSAVNNPQGFGDDEEEEQEQGEQEQ
jgi:hypothetical protein